MTTENELAEKSAQDIAREFLFGELLNAATGGAGEYVGTLKVSGQHGDIQIQLDAQLSADVLKLCAESLTRATKELASSMTVAVFEAAGLAIEDKTL